VVVRRGSVASGCLTILLLLALLLFVGIHVGGPYYRYYQFRDAAKQEARFGTMHTDDMIRKSLLAQADSLGLPEEAYFIRIQRTQRAIRIQSSYGDSWTIGSYTRPVHFDLDIQDTL
jgi:hypothetical protein